MEADQVTEETTVAKCLIEESEDTQFVGEMGLQQNFQKLKEEAIAQQNTKALSRASISPLLQKRGYLFKWVDRAIGWGGSKWGLRFVKLEGGRLSYFGSHTDASPRYTLTVRRPCSCCHTLADVSSSR